MESNIYAAIEHWWGEPLTSNLLERITLAPGTHVRQFISEFEENSVLPKPEKPPTGHLRPLLLESISGSAMGAPTFGNLRAAVPILMYAHEVAVEFPIRNRRNRAEVNESFAWLLRLKPLVEQGAVSFVDYTSRDRHPSRTHTYTSFDFEQIPDDLREAFKTIEQFSSRSFNEPIESIIFMLRSDIGTSINLAAKFAGALQPCALSGIESALLSIGLRRAALSSLDTRNIHLRKLAMLNVPRLVTDPGSLVSVRRSEESFAQWRLSLARALTEIGNISEDDPQWALHASAIVHAELEPARQEILKATKKSAWMTAVKDGMTSLSYSAVGAIAGVSAGGRALPTIVGAATGKSIEVFGAYLNTIRERRSSRAVLDLMLSFDATPQNDA